MKALFERHEIRFIIWTSVIFLVSIVGLVITGFIPTEFKVGGGETFEQRTRTAVREILEGKAGTPNTQAGIAGTNGNAVGGTNNSTNNTNTGNGQSATNITGANYGQSTGPATSYPVITTTGNNSIRAENPVRIVIPAISVDGNIVNPNDTSFEVLDTALTKGAVRYPGSGYPGSGNMFIFGHSTSFSVVQNQAYKIFNKLKNLKTGDVITIYGTSASYEYRVTTVKKVDKSKELVEFDTTQNMLTLSTCDSFGRAEDRYVIEAQYIGATMR